VGAAVGLSGYIASIDRPFKDGIVLAAEALNKSGGILGRKVEVVIEDMRSEPVDTVTAVKKFTTSDKVGVMINGCSSAGNAAALPLAERAKTPIMMCSVLPPDKALHKWGFSMLAAPAAEVEPRIDHVAKNLKLAKIGVLYDPTPYAGLQKAAAEQLAQKAGLTVVAVEKYQMNDADLTAYFTKLASSGAEAVLKLGAGPSTVVAAKAVKQLALKTPLLTSAEDLAVFREAGGVLGAQFYFVASPSQIYETLPPASAERKAIDQFLTLWRAQHGDRDPTWASRGWDALHIVAAAIKKSGTANGEKVRDAVEATTGYRGASAEFTYSADAHYGIRKNPWTLAQVVDGRVKIAE
jgi:branched-chain amino acid transport system substrate-binding protein